MADNEFNDFDAFFPRAVTQKLGMVMSGSLSKGLEVKLDPSAPIEEMAVGRYVIIEGEQLKF
ncbi:MAG: hypothetical protein KDI62_30525, partial [Anaerolineae bacterium]|nr:hypothetical protein [Anaerolineae bacterium]